MATNSADLLATIVAATARVVAVRRSRAPFDEVAARAEARARTPCRGFRRALGRSDRVNVIAECKRRSPSRGVLRDDYVPAAIAAAYERAGAAAISVLTEPTFFDGALDHLEAVAARTHLPVLRKDFIVDEYQVAESRAAGADAILLIVAVLDDATLRALYGTAAGWGLDVLVEVHDQPELERALAAGASLVGVNNRNLRTLEVNSRVSQRLIERMPASATAVSESGFRSAAELAALRHAGYHAFLVGERLMSSPDPGAALQDLLADPAAGGRP